MRKKITFAFILLAFCTVEVFSQQPVKIVLLEEFTTAQCGFCPDGDLIADAIVSDHSPNVITIAHHAGFGVDSMTAPGCATIANTFTTFAPGGLIDRGDYPCPPYTSAPYIAVSRQKWDSLVVVRLNDTAFCDVTIVNSYDTATNLLNTTVNVDFAYTPIPGDFRLNLFIAEDSVSNIGSGYDQTNYFDGTSGHPYYQAGDPIIGYIHRHVVRKIASAVWGETGIIPNNPTAGNNYSYTFSNVSISPNWKEKDIDVIAFVSYYNTDAHYRTVLNSSHEPLLEINTSTVISCSTEVSNTKLYPNPVRDIGCIEMYFPESTLGKIEIADITGKVIQTVQEKQFNAGINYYYFSASSLTNGTYFLRIDSQNGKVVKKFVVVN